MYPIIKAYKKIASNFFSAHRSESITIFLFLVIFSVVVQLNLMEIVKDGNRIKIGLGLSAIAYAVWSTLTYVARDQEALSLNFFNLRQLFFLRFINAMLLFLVYGIAATFILIYRQLNLSILVNIGLAAICLSTLYAAIVVFFKSKVKNKSKPLSLFPRTNKSLTKVKTVIAFWVTVLLRQERRKLAIMLTSIAMSVGVGFFMPADLVDGKWMFCLLIPTAIMVVSSIDMSCESFKYIHLYQSDKRYIFILDFLLWIFFIWCFVILMLLTMGWVSLKTMSIVVLIIPILLLYTQLIKFYYMDKKIMKALTLAISLVMPLFIPFFAIVSAKRILQ